MGELFNFDFNIAELNVILKGMKKLPYEESASTIQKIIDGHTEQLKAKEAKEVKEVKPKKEVK